MNELSINAIIQQHPVIDFKDYGKLLQEATIIAEKLNEMEVNEDNVKEQKKLLAAVNKSVKALNDRRISIKKELLKPYQDFENQVKEIEKVVKDADERLRTQVRELEEVERIEKQKELHKLWDKKIQGLYNSGFYVFEDWLEQRHLNKSTSFSKCENEMDDFIEKVEKDLSFLSEQEGSNIAIKKYLECYDVTETLQYLNDLKKIEEIKEVFEEVEVIEEETDEVAVFEITGTVSIRLIEMLMNENKINYRRIK